MSYTEIKSHNGNPTIFVDGKILAPMAMTLRRIDDEEYIRKLGESGIKCFFVRYERTDWSCPGKDYIDEHGNTVHEPSGFEMFSDSVHLLLRNVPDAYIIVRICMSPPASWVSEHPDDAIQYSDGEGMAKSGYSSYFSLASENWRKDALIELEKFCKKIENTDYFNRVIGFFFGAGGTMEWYYEVPVIDFEKNRVADFSPAFRKEYKKFLIEKYKTEENLKKAWRDESATFDNPIIPTLEQREIIDKEKDVLSYAKKCWGLPKDLFGTKREFYYDLFLDMDKDLCVSDFYDAWAETVADSVICFAKYIKNRFKGLLTGSFFGAWGCTNFYDSASNGGTRKLINSGMLDFISTPSTYVNRQPGGYASQRVMIDSVRLRNMVVITEEDSRSHIAEQREWRVLNELSTARDSVVTLKRDFARNICDETYSWWFDMGINSGWYDDKDILELFSVQQKIANAGYKYNNGKSNEIAAIYSTNSLHCISRYTSEVMIDFYRNTELSRLGAGIDFYFNEDLANPDMPDYKVYLMINLFNLSDKERKQIHKKASKNKATVIWLFAPGIINPDEGKRVDIKNIEDITGMKVEFKNGIYAYEFLVDDQSRDVLRYADVDRKYGFIDRKFKSIVGVLNPIEANIAPGIFYIDDKDAKSLGKYLFGKETALAMKKDKYGVTNIYCTAKVLRSELISSIMEYSGCHLYNREDDVVYVSNDFITIHASYTGKHTLYFNKKCSPFEVYERKYYDQDTDKLELDMKLGDTLMFSINDNINKELSN